MPPSVGEAPKSVGVLFDGALEGVADEGVGELAVLAGADVDFEPGFGGGALAAGGGEGFFDAAGFAGSLADVFGAGFGSGFGGSCFFDGGTGLLLFASVAGFAAVFSGFFGAGAFTAFGGFGVGFADAFFP